jgi:hypothetical protein
MSPISRSFRGQRPLFDGARVPPGHHVVDEFPVLSVGSTPHRPLDEWTFRISGAVDEPISWTWDELLALPAETPTVDIHCVTAWSKLDTDWNGISIDTLMEGLETEAEYVSAWCNDGYRTNLPLDDVTGGRAWIACEFDGDPLEPGAAARPDCWSRTCTSGRAPSACADWSCWTRTAQGSGRPPATTTTVTRGRSSAMRVTETTSRSRPRAKVTP